MPSKPSYLSFNRPDCPWKPDIDYRLYPQLYRVGKGEQGVLICEPYKSEKYDSNPDYAPLNRGAGNRIRAKSASLFYEKWQAAAADPLYIRLKKQGKQDKG